jgi:hypothetical protein
MRLLQRDGLEILSHRELLQEGLRIREVGVDHVSGVDNEWKGNSDKWPDGYDDSKIIGRIGSRV